MTTPKGPLYQKRVDRYEALDKYIRDHYSTLVKLSSAFGEVERGELYKLGGFETYTDYIRKLVQDLEVGRQFPEV